MIQSYFSIQTAQKIMIETEINRNKQKSIAPGETIEIFSLSDFSLKYHGPKSLNKELKNN